MTFAKWFHNYILNSTSVVGVYCTGGLTYCVCGGPGWSLKVGGSPLDASLFIDSRLGVGDSALWLLESYKIFGDAFMWIKKYLYLYVVWGSCLFNVETIVKRHKITIEIVIKSNLLYRQQRQPERLTDIPKLIEKIDISP